MLKVHEIPDELIRVGTSNTEMKPIITMEDKELGRVCHICMQGENFLYVEQSDIEPTSCDVISAWSPEVLGILYDYMNPPERSQGDAPEKVGLTVKETQEILGSEDPIPIGKLTGRRRMLADMVTGGALNPDHAWPFPTGAKDA